MFNGSVFNFAGSPVAKVAGISYKSGGSWVDVTQPADLNKLFELGQTDLTVSLKFKGHCGMTLKAKGTASITWADGTSDSLPGTWQVGPMTPGEGDIDAPITGAVELRPTVPDVS
jgi:hypothetical protein